MRWSEHHHAPDAWPERHGPGGAQRQDEPAGQDDDGGCAAGTASRYTASRRSMPSRLPEPAYGPGDLVYRVYDGGRVTFKGRPWRVGRALIGQHVAVRPRIDADGAFVTPPEPGGGTCVAPSQSPAASGSAAPSSRAWPTRRPEP